MFSSVLSVCLLPDAQMNEAVRGAEPDPQYQLRMQFYIKEPQNSEAKCDRPPDPTGFSPIAFPPTGLLIGEARTKRTQVIAHKTEVVSSTLAGRSHPQAKKQTIDGREAERRGAQNVPIHTRIHARQPMSSQAEQSSAWCEPYLEPHAAVGRLDADPEAK